MNLINMRSLAAQIVMQTKFGVAKALYFADHVVYTRDFRDVFFTLPRYEFP